MLRQLLTFYGYVWDLKMVLCLIQRKQAYFDLQLRHTLDYLNLQFHQLTKI